MEIIKIEGGLRYGPLLPCPWRRDMRLKPSAQDKIDVWEEVRWLKGKWGVNFHQISQGALYDLDSWYLIGSGIMAYSFQRADASEAAVEKLLTAGQQALTKEEKEAILEQYSLPGEKVMDLKKLVESGDEMKCHPLGSTFVDAFFCDPFHRRMLRTAQQPSCITVSQAFQTPSTAPVCSYSLPNLFAWMASNARTYSPEEDMILTALFELGRK